MTRYKIIATLILLIAAMPMTAAVRKIAQPDTRLKLEKALSSAHTATDSIALLYNIYDLSKGNEADSAAARIYRVARANGYDEMAIDILRDIAQIHSDNDSILTRIQHTLQNEFTESNLQKETVIFVKLYRTYLATTYATEKELKEKITEVIDEYDGKFSDDPYERLLQQFLMCIFISHETKSTLLNQYIDALERQMRNIPRQSDKLNARLYSQKAYSYTVNSDYRQAVEADRKLIELYDKVERINAAQGRPYRNLDRFRHSSFTRMLSNYQALSTSEVDSIYRLIKHIEAANPEIRSKNGIDETGIFVNMAHGNYAAAIEPLRRLTETKLDHNERRYLLKMLMYAAEQCGRRDVLIEAATAYSKLTENYIDSRLSECLRQLQTIFYVDRLRGDSIANELKAQTEIGRRRTLIIEITVAMAILSIIVVLVFARLYIRFRRLSKRLEVVNRHLTARHDELHARTDELRAAIAEATRAEQRKASFIRYISSTLLLPLHSLMEYSQKLIDSSRGDAKPFLQRFGEVMRENSERLRNLATRLLHLSRHDTDPNSQEGSFHKN